MDYPYLEHPVTDEDDIPVEVEIDEVQVRMECLRLVMNAETTSASPAALLTVAGQFAAFVIHGTVPASN